MDEITQQIQAKLDAAVSASAGAAWSSAAQLGTEGLHRARAATAEALDPAVERGQELLATARAHFGVSEEAVLGRIREGVHAAIEHPAVAAAACGGAAMLLLPPARRALYASTIGRVRSVESQAASAARRGASLRQALDAQAKEMGKLAERVQLAQEEYARGRAKLVAAGSQLRSLAASSRAVESRAAVLLDDLRHMRALPGAPELRKQAAEAAAAAATARAAAEKQLKRVACMVPV